MPTRKLLLADDSVTTQRVIELTFSHEDMQVITAGDGEEAIARITQDRPDIVLADIGMPKRSGYDVAAFIKSDPALAHIPVLLLAGAFEPVDDAKANQVGSNGVLVKPFEPQHVIARVRELIGGVQGHPTSAAAADIPRPVTRLASPKPVELPRRETPQPIAIDTDIDFPPAPAASPRQVQAAPQARAPQPAPQPAGPPPDGADSLDDYFDRLDAAFADLDGPPPARDARRAAPPVASAPLSVPQASRAEGPVLEHDLDFIDMGTSAAHDRAIDLPIDLPIDRQITAPLDRLAAIDVDVDVDVDDDAGLEATGEIPTLEELLGEVGDKSKLDEESFSIDEALDAELAPPAEAVQAVRPAPAPPAPVPPVPVPPVPVAPAPVPSAAIAPLPQPARPAASIADAFSALLAVEQGEVNAPVVRLGGGTPGEPAITE